ncbi:MAG: hypothetical protein JSW10_03490 [Pseudomonadota bacterium]|nr:MAG: hypothetical protein JSW10_03490 [Pseudomonadota bacterium]
MTEPTKVSPEKAVDGAADAARTRAPRAEDQRASKVRRIPMRRSSDVVAYLMEREHRATGRVRRPAA